LLKYK